MPTSQPAPASLSPATQKSSSRRRASGGAKLLLFGLVLGFAIIALFSYAITSGYAAPLAMAQPQYIVLAWNDLGMHCYNRDFKDLGVLPPYNNLWAQVIRVDDPPVVITTGVSVSYYFADNTYSVGKSNFWTYAQPLFGLSSPLPNNIGLTGKGLAGPMDVKSDHFQADGIPLTEFSDSAPTISDPYQLATIVVTDTNTGVQLARVVTVAPVSTEMHCDYCHSDNGPGAEGIATHNVNTNILTKHDHEEGTHLMTSRPVLCAKCHASNALGAPGQAGIPNFSRAMHSRHNGEVPNTMAGCYNCHPGPNTRCLRDVMSSQHNMTCISCHGGLSQVASSNRNPWLDEPRCDTGACHGTGNAQNDPLYRHSTGHAGIYCEGCHDSTHAIAPSTQSKDATKFITWQGLGGPLRKCTACHATLPVAPGPHNIAPIDWQIRLSYMPFVGR
jgi:hypothetical protein